MSTTSEPEAALTKSVPAHVAETVSCAEQELLDLLRQRAAILRRISTIRKMLTGMASLFGHSILEHDCVAATAGTSGRRKGFTPACRQLLMEADTPLRARQACVELQQRFPELTQHHKDLNASVTTVFHRLVKYGQAQCHVDDHGVKVWEWATDRDVKAQSAYTSIENARARKLIPSSIPVPRPVHPQPD
jgi:hypothetical protein